jgi:hypothetical protein
MKRLVLFVLALLLTFPGPALQRPPREDEPVRLPNGRSQREEILRADHEKSLQDAAQLLGMAESLKIELEKNDRHVLSLSVLKKTEEIEKLAKRIRTRLKRF